MITTKNQRDFSENVMDFVAFRKNDTIFRRKKV